MILKPLLIDHDYKIINSASGQIARTFWQTQKVRSVKPIVVCSKTDFNVETKVDVIEIVDYSNIRHIGGLLRELGLPDFCHIPDQRRFSWKPFVLNNSDVCNAAKGCDYIHSISCPETSHLIALALKKKFGKKWVAQFNDPWVGNEAKSFKIKKFEEYDFSLEGEVAKNADLIIHTNKIMMEDWVTRYGTQILKKMVEIPLSFNMPLPERLESSINIEPKLSLFHIGHLYGARSAGTLFQALSKLFSNKPQMRNLVELNFIGGLSNTDVQKCNELGLNDCVHFLGTMRPEELDPYYRKADMFVVIDMNIERSPSFPSKLMLYHYYQKPILSITTKNSIIEEDMLQSGNSCFYYNQINELADFIDKAVSDRSLLYKFDHDYWKRYSVDSVASTYFNLIDKYILKDE